MNTYIGRIAAALVNNRNREVNNKLRLLRHSFILLDEEYVSNEIEKEAIEEFLKLSYVNEYTFIQNTRRIVSNFRNNFYKTTILDTDRLNEDQLIDYGFEIYRQFDERILFRIPIIVLPLLKSSVLLIKYTNPALLLSVKDVRSTLTSNDIDDIYLKRYGLLR